MAIHTFSSGLLENPHIGAHSGGMPFGDDVIITVRVQPAHSPTSRPQEIELLGSQTLQTLYHHIYCIENTCVSGELNGVFYIEGAFYAENSEDDKDSASATLRTIERMKIWIDSTWHMNRKHAESSSSSGPARKRKSRDRSTSLEGAAPVVNNMKCRLDDLEISTDKKYLLFHKAGCEHTINFTEIRTITRSLLSFETNQFPRTTQHAVINRRKCGVCLIQSAKFLCFGDRLADSNPFFYCEHCYYSLHYDKYGTLLYDDFQVFDYDHDGS